MSFVLRLKPWHYREEDDDFEERNRRKQESYDPEKHCGVPINEMGKLNLIFSNFVSKN